MIESSVLNAQCEQCNYSWDPFGKQKFTVPHYATIICPECKHEQKMRWLDNETQKLYAKKELGLDDNDRMLNQKIRDLEHKLELLTKEVELEKKKRELFEVELDKFHIWVEGREEDFRHIETLAQEMDEEYKFREDHK